MLRFRLIGISTLLLLVFISTACPRYDAVRKFSTEKVKIDEQFTTTLENHFSIVEQFADAQLKVTTQRVDEITSQIQQRYASRTRKLLEQDPNITPEAREKILMDMAAAVSADSAQSELDKLRIAALVAQLKLKDREILEAQKEILQATKQLDEWVQLKKFDEILTLRLTDKLKLSQEKLNKAMTEVNNIWGALIGLLPKEATSK